jgi:hypothetical protein
MKNKKGGEKILFLWWFFMMAIVAAGIVGGIFMYYSLDADVRSLQAQIIGDRVIGCISENGFLKKEVLELKEQEQITSFFSKNCSIRDEKGIYLGISFGNLREEMKFGDFSLESECNAFLNLEKETKKYFSGCANSSQHFSSFGNARVERIPVSIVVGIKPFGGRGAEDEK